MVNVPKAVGDRPVWPLPTVFPKRVYTHGGKAFGASRASGKRHHVGIDLLAPRGAVVVAPESGTVVATQGFNGPNAHAILIQNDSGAVVLLGEVEPGSWNKYGVKVGSWVAKGQPVADVGINPGGSTMLHFEMYTSGTRKNSRWLVGSPPPANVLDPTAYLQAAAQGEPVEPVEDDHDHDGEEEHGHTDPDHGESDSEDKTDTDDKVHEGEIVDPDDVPPDDHDVGLPDPNWVEPSQRGMHPFQNFAIAMGVVAALDAAIRSGRGRRR